MRLDATDLGKGAPVVLLHGFPLDRSIWASRPAGPFRWILPDLRGHGASPVAETATMEEQARDVIELLDRLGIERAVVGGHSMGGYVLLALLRLAPERVAGAVLVTSRAAADSEEARRAREISALRVLKEGPAFLAEAMVARFFTAGPEPEAAAAVRKLILHTKPEGIAAALRGMAQRADSTALLGTIKVPTLVVVGSGDQIVPAAEGEAMAKAIPGAKLAVFERSGHLPPLEEPDRFRAVLGAFLHSVRWTR